MKPGHRFFGSQFVRELHCIEACAPPRSLPNHQVAVPSGSSLPFFHPTVRTLFGYELSQFLRELHFIEAIHTSLLQSCQSGRSSFGNCTSLRLGKQGAGGKKLVPSQFLRELHFIEAS